ncbi:MAG: hypothetical protein GF329_07445 [Candidatus Lokiarchaeota archaeon]|nr:hypothetical protein [Candidatus Lokiarchaeota archaeon]
MKKEIFEIKRSDSDNDAQIDILGNRAMILFAGTFQTLMREIESIIGIEAQGVLYNAGIYSGRFSSKTLLKSWEERGESFLEKWASFYDSNGVGWFKIEEINVDLNKGTGYIRITDSLTAKNYIIPECREKKVDSSRTFYNPACHFIAGFFAGVFEILSGKNLECHETKCITKNDPYCEFTLTNY